MEAVHHGRDGHEYEVLHVYIRNAQCDCMNDITTSQS